MARKMAETVVLRHPETGEPTAVLAGSEAPSWAEKAITNSAVYEASETKAPAKGSRAAQKSGDE